MQSSLSQRRVPLASGPAVAPAALLHPRAHRPRCSTSPRATPPSKEPVLGERLADTAPSTSSLPTDPVQLVTWGGRLPSRRRFVIGTASATVMALGANFLGITSALLSLDGGKLAAQLRTDTLVPVNGMKRCADFEMLFEFVYPASWVADQTLVLRAARRIEQENALDPLSIVEARKRAKPRTAEPLAAFGPPGTSGEENMSVIVAPILPGFKLSSLGTPQDQANWFLGNIAYEGSGKTATLVDARARSDGKQDYYEMEYVLQSRTFTRHNISVYTTRDDLLYTFNAQCPEATWSRDKEVLRKAADSFQLMPLA